MTPFINLRGYAAPFLQAEQWNGTSEFFDPNAFHDQLLATGDVFLNFGEHSAAPICRPVALFADEYGLGFLASVPAATWATIGRAVLSDCQRCSISMTSADRTSERLGDGTPSSRITRARIDHITICSEAVFAGTGVWPADVQGEMPSRLAQLAARWERGRAQWLGAEKQRGAVAAEKRQRALAASRSPVAAGAGRYAEFRRSIAAAIATNGWARSQVMCHAAFTKTAGFDAQEFMAEIVDARFGWKSSGR